MSLTFNNNRFVLKNKIGEGSFGQVFNVFDTKLNCNYCVKLEDLQSKHKQLLYEASVYQLCLNKKLNCTPNMILFNMEGEFYYMIIERMKYNLKEYIKNCLKSKSTRYKFMMASKLIECLKKFHEGTRLIHRDLKPENIVVDEFENVFLIDFGLSKKFKCLSGHIPFRYREGFIGTQKYASTFQHNHNETSRRDDLQSLSYVILSMFQNLPWAKYDNISDKKKRVKLIYECKLNANYNDIPDLLRKFIKYTLNMRFNEIPLYNDWMLKFKNYKL